MWLLKILVYLLQDGYTFSMHLNTNAKVGNEHFEFEGKAKSVVPGYGPLIRNPCKPPISTITNHLQNRAHTSDPFENAKGAHTMDAWGIPGNSVLPKVILNNYSQVRPPARNAAPDQLTIHHIPRLAHTLDLQPS